ncbi:aldo/keto reductase [Streptomyces aculeolatus]
MAIRKRRGIPSVSLNSGRDIPLLGLDTRSLDDGGADDAVSAAITLGYRLFETAAGHRNEAGVGLGIAQPGILRERLFVSVRLSGAGQGSTSTRASLHASLERLHLDYVDLCLLQGPLPRLGRFVETYESMVEMADEGLIRSLGVADFEPGHIRKAVAETGVVPAVNQIELSPALPRAALRRFHNRRGIRTQASSPLGVARRAPGRHVVTSLAAKYQRSPAQIILRWHVQQGIIALPRSLNTDGQRTNADIFDFKLQRGDMDLLSDLDNPETHESL